VRGWLTAVNASDGKIAWRAYSTRPDSEVLIGPASSPTTTRTKDLGVHSWPPDHWKIGGGTNPGPWNPELRPGDNKWTAGIFARDPHTGEAVWFYQWSPHDLYDHDGVNENILVDLTIDGQSRKVLLHPERNGYVYVIDRLTGQVLRHTLRPHHHQQRRRSENRPPHRRRGKRNENRQSRSRPRPCSAGRKRLATQRLVAAHQPPLHPSSKPHLRLRRH
jgi:glucose dehydrogenase